MKKTKSIPMFMMWEMLRKGCGPWMLCNEYNPGKTIEEFLEVEKERKDKYDDLVLRHTKGQVKI